MRITVSADDLTGLEPLSAGHYSATIAEQEHFTSKGDPSGPGNIRVTFAIDGGNTSDGKPRMVFRNYSLKKQAMWSLGALVKAAKIDYGEDDEGNVDFETEDLVDQEVTLKLGQREFEGRISNNVDSVLPYKA